MADKHPYLDKFLTEGGPSLTDREYLTLLLSYCGKLSPEAAADDLLRVYGSFATAADADPKPLANTIDSVDAAVLFRLISRLSAIFVTEENGVLRLKSSKDAKLYFSGSFTGITSERMIIAAADRTFRITSTHTIYSDSPLEVKALSRDIADFVITSKADRIFIAHNHPIGNASPSAGDIMSTDKIIAALSKLGTALIDHIIIGKNGAYSMRDQKDCKSLNSQPSYGYK